MKVYPQQDLAKTVCRASRLVCGLLVLVACSQPSGPSQILRLADLLPTAEIESPLAGLPAAERVGELGDVRVEEIWRADLRQPAAALSIEGHCVGRSDEEIGPTLLCSREGRATTTHRIDPGRYYRVALQARNKRPLGYLVKLVESSPQGPLRIFQYPDFRGRWQPFEIWFRSTQESSSLEIVVEPRHGSAELEIADLVLERLELTPEQEMSLLKSQDSRADPATDLGLVKRGRLLPIDDPEDADSPRASNYAIRDAIFAPAPTDLRFSLVVPEGAWLSFSYAFAREATPGDRANLRVVVSEEGRQDRTLFEEDLTLEAGSWRWHEWSGSLAEHGGRRVDLVFQTRAASREGRAYVYWGNPEIHTNRREKETNVILIAVDTLRADRLSCYGNAPGTTPAMDSLAEDGTRFEQAISSANWTTPSFEALFTGRSGPRFAEHLGRVEARTLAEHLQEAGYSTAAILYKPALYDKAFDRGFDIFLNAPRYHIRAEENLADALAWLDRNRDRRFFLFLHFDDPHQPFCQPPASLREDLRARLEGYGLELPIMVSDRHASSVDPEHPMRAFEQRRGCRDCRADGALKPDFRQLADELYDDAVRYVDGQIGLFLDALKEADLYDSSVIALVSDHGEALWNHHDQFGHAGSNLHDELIRVPLIVKVPGGSGWARNRTVRSQVRLIDLMPTLLELAGAESPVEKSPAESFASVLLAGSSGELDDRPVLSVGQDESSLSLRYRGFKYIRYENGRQDPDRPAVEELYDLTHDPREKNDVADEHPRLMAQMREAVDHLSAVGGDDGREGEPPSDPIDARQLEALRALGYIQ
ncbi:MAG: hypothetical protein DWQ30_08600 [Acidobacteria bacterium]|nr:MAG: hypothetical protein DWQ30_08600 [Acidobacteriota bacterium]